MARQVKCPRCGEHLGDGSIEHEYADFVCASCEDEIDEDEIDDDPNDGVDERGDGSDLTKRPCIDPGTCCCPHPDHTADECEFHEDDEGIVQP